MTLNEKIRATRIRRGLTQEQVASGCVTRNMMCEIEAGKAEPSLKTLRHIASKLHVSVGFLLDPERTEEEEEVAALLPRLYALLAEGRILECLETVPDSLLHTKDPAFSYFLATCYLTAAEKCAAAGSVTTALQYLDHMDQSCNDTFYQTEHLRARAVLLRALSRDPVTPRYAIDDEAYSRLSSLATGAELYHYIKDDWDYPYRSDVYRSHMEAKRLMKQYRFPDAIAILQPLCEDKNKSAVSLLVLFRLYSDLETCYRERKDFESAYRYANKKNALYASFRT